MPIAEEIKNFELLQSQQITHELDDLVSKYQGTAKTEEIKEDNGYLRQAVQKLAGDQEVLAQYFSETGGEERLAKYVAHFSGMSGIVGFNRPVEFITAQKQGAPLKILNEDPEKRFTSLEYWEQESFLQIHLFFLLKLYCYLKKDLITQLPATKIDIDRALIKEITVTANAYRIRRMYQKIAQEKDKESLFASFAKQFLMALKTILATMEYGDEQPFPCGLTNHAMYVTFVYLENRVLIRVDNLGLGAKFGGHIENDNKAAPCILSEIALTVLTTDESLITYLTGLCLAREQSADDALPRIYTKKLPLPETKFNYPLFDMQTVNNCVVENFKVGMKYRLWELSGTIKDRVYQWLISNTMKFTLDDVSIEPHEDDEFKKINRLKRKKEQQSHTVETARLSQDPTVTTQLLGLLDQMTKLQLQQQTAVTTIDSQMRALSQQTKLLEKTDIKQSQLQQTMDGLKDDLERYSHSYDRLQEKYNKLLDPRPAAQGGLKITINRLEGAELGENTNVKQGKQTIEILKASAEVSEQIDICINDMKKAKVGKSSTITSDDLSIKVDAKEPDRSKQQSSSQDGALQPPKLINQMVKRISRNIERNIFEKKSLQSDWNKLNNQEKDQILLALEKDLTKELLGEDLQSQIAKLVSADAKKRCATAIANAIVGCCEQLNQIKVAAHDIHQAMIKFSAEEVRLLQNLESATLHLAK